ncbi:hypothetical protein [Celeribacter sp.]|uniref:hypothetical protein n=1 Tax=Celeribacter sp. TaxID=1890673 RepID=UPI003A9312A1
MRLPVVLGLILASGQASLAQDPSATLALELNTATPTETGCSLTFVAQSTLPDDVDALVLETVLFDTSGQVSLMTMLDFSALPSGRSRVRQFALPNAPCDQIGKLLFNGVQTCDGAQASPASCDAALTVSSRTDIEVTR